MKKEIEEHSIISKMKQQYQMFKIFLKRHEDSQDRTKITAIPSTTNEILRNTNGYLSDQLKPIKSVSEQLRNDINNYNNWLTKIIELKTELRTAKFDIIKLSQNSHSYSG